ncbi:M1 family aminopeptidase [Granulicoccus sp. GXG6511]|uniref:M1 family aminopeptidase n=1 Tax=Granulicoccus sp. GXG6511 TaxID=3381351 RepID=UPI003D7D3CC5
MGRPFRRNLRWATKILASALACVLLSSCTGGTGGTADNTADEGRPPPDARPQVALEFRMADDLRSAQGTERVTFVPDLEVCELVFRAWPNKPITARAGNSLTVTTATVDGEQVRPDVSPGGAPEGSPGTLVELPLPSCVPAGTPISAELGFELGLGPDTDERVGYSRSEELAWLGTAYPLLAWENGRGWLRDAAVPVTGETATSEAFALTSLRVTAPSQFSVLGVGEPLPPETDPATGRTTHEFKAPAVRDVTVTVGRMSVVEKRVGGTTIHVGGPADKMARSPEEWSDAIARSLTAVSDYLGPVPYEHLWVSVIPEQTEGIEFPGAIQFGQLRGPRDQWIVTHEIAHLWFYGLVGNNQAQHPWMDESFASFVQRVVDDPNRSPRPQHDYPGRLANQVGDSMDSWGSSRRASNMYVNAVYLAGADMLIEARDAAGHAEFDNAVRSYLADNAHRIATPDDVANAFRDQPQAVERMQEAGALP